jgi:ssDNA-binding Zn-finger/Zn-ribbon topoisomerase 1
MGLKCSVIGHKYGEASVEREREEQGSEVVITIQERETCERCGKERVVSENKEVTSIETPSDIAGEMVEDEESESTDEAGEEAVETDESDEEVSPAADTDEGVESVDPDADDAEILDAESETPVGDSELDDPSTVEPVTDTEDVVEDDPEEDDGVIIDAEDGEQPDDDREPGEWPEEPNSGGDDWSPETIGKEEDTEEESPDVEPLGGSAVTVPEGQFTCPECDFSTDVESSSLRAGDFCPECHKGALVTTSE